MSCTLEEPTTEPQVGKKPYKKRRKPCIICGEPSVGVTGYVFMADGSNKIGVPLCQFHLDDPGEWAITPVFENQDAFNLFKKEHSGLFKRIQNKLFVFLHPPKTDVASVA